MGDGAAQRDAENATPQPRRARRVRGRLSWPEWILLFTLVLFLLSTIVPAIFFFRGRARLEMARHDISVLSLAILRYQREYGTWPAKSTQGGADTRFGRERPNAELMSVLRAETTDVNRSEELNPQRMVFLEVETYQQGWSGLDSRGEWLDPWGSPYQVVLDSNYDTAAEADRSIYGRVSGLGVLVWSNGPDRKTDTADDLLSWFRK